jgi:hypothetical protein
MSLSRQQLPRRGLSPDAPQIGQRPKLSLQRRTNWPEYRILRTEEPYNESVFLRLDREAIKRAQDRLRKQAAKLGFQLVPQQGTETCPE